MPLCSVLYNRPAAIAQRKVLFYSLSHKVDKGRFARIYPADSARAAPMVSACKSGIDYILDFANDINVPQASATVAAIIESTIKNQST